MESLQSGLPLDLEPLRFVQVAEGTMFEVERLLHLKFEPLRVRGEWFQGTPELLHFAKHGDVPQAVAEVAADLAPKTTSQGMSLLMLAQQTGLSERTIRYYISQGLVPPPLTMGRSAAYDEEHVKRLLQIQSWKKEGLSIQDMSLRLTTSWVTPTLSFQRWRQYQIASDVQVWVQSGLPESRQQQIERNLLAFAAGVEE